MTYCDARYGDVCHDVRSVTAAASVLKTQAVCRAGTPVGLIGGQSCTGRGFVLETWPLQAASHAPSLGSGMSLTDNRAVEPAKVVEQLWSRVQARDWVGVGELLAKDFVLVWPRDLVRLRGRANFVEFNRSYPEGWSIEVLRIVAQGNTVVSEVRVPHPTVGPYYALSFYDVDGGQIAGCREYWVMEAYEEPVGERARWFEPT
jgi:ketosteroid isomerase-like protein